MLTLTQRHINHSLQDLISLQLKLMQEWKSLLEMLREMLLWVLTMVQNSNMNSTMHIEQYLVTFTSTLQAGLIQVIALKLIQMALSKLQSIPQLNMTQLKLQVLQMLKTILVTQIT